MEGTDDAAGAEEFDSTYYDYGDGLANETADESTVEFTGKFKVHVCSRSLPDG